jgi:hypothetical protein
MEKIKMYSVYAVDGRYDENYFVKSKSAAKAKKLVQEVTDGKVQDCTLWSLEDCAEFDINPDEYAVDEPHLYDEGC